MIEFKGKILLITGGTGSFGNVVLNFFASSDIQEIRIFSRDEKKQDDLRKKFSSDKIKFIIGDVRDRRSVLAALRNVDFVFHAAALKQVPSCETYPYEALQTNVIGTKNVIDAAIECGVKKVICLSTDKAAYPINAMGISKAMMEKVALAEAKRLIGSEETTICVTRYGNVMASRGSVIPLFIDQIMNNKPLTVTSLNMTRFLMSLDEALKLVLFAFENGEQGDLFVQKSPATDVRNLAECLLDIFKSNSRIVEVGVRPGEKMYETLLTSEEFCKAIDLGDFFRVPMISNIDQVQETNLNLLSARNDYNSNNTHQLNKVELTKLLLRLSCIKSKIR